MNLSPTVVADIKACEGIYRAADVARHYGVHRCTVGRVWDGALHASVSPSDDFPEIQTRLRSSDLYEAAQTLLERGNTVAEAAQALDVSIWTIYKVRAGMVGVY